jgi:hypothetical protein
MRRFVKWVGCAWLAASAVACAGANREVPLLDEHPVSASAGQGGGAEIDTGDWAWVNETRKSEHARRELYWQVSEELGLDGQDSAVHHRARLRKGSAVGGSGMAGQERRGCTEVLAAGEPAAVVSGTLDFAQDGLLTVNVPGQGAMKLRTDASTCAVQSRHALSPESLLEGSEVRIAYVLEEGLPTARVIRAEPLRFTR